MGLVGGVELLGGVGLVGGVGLLGLGGSALSFVTYSAAPARRLSFAYPSLILRSSFAEGS